MTLEAEVYYTPICDRCGRRYETGEYEAWIDPKHADEMAWDSEWHVEGGNHICWDCVPDERPGATT